MKCVWTQKVSLLIDGELDRAEAREVERHLDTCGDCREAQADFLSLRRQIADYRIDLDAFAGQRALKRILAAGASGGKIETGKDKASSRRGRGFAGVFGMPRLSPVGLAALLLLVGVVAVGIISLTNSRRPSADVAKTSPTPARPIATNEVPKDSTAGKNNGGEAIAGNNQKQTGEQTGEVAGKAGGTSVTGERRRVRAPRVAGAGEKVKKSAPALKRLPVDVPVAETARNNGATLDGGASTLEASDTGDDLLTRRARDVADDSKTARHVEQAQLLLRSFRNARVSEAGRRASSDLAYDKRQSKKLLYQNIVLRREAASRGNLPVESLLDSLEPILIDIANLPDKPAPEDVRAINERMRRKNLVAMLQISSVESASAARGY
jgi:Putative zinc-finger